MSKSSYERCHVSHRGYMSSEISIAREIMRKYGKPCSDSIKEFRHKTDMPMDECCNMLRCLWRDTKLENVQAENAKLREVASIVAYCMQAERDCDGCKMNGAAGTVTEPAGCDVLLDLLRELGVIA